MYGSNIGPRVPEGQTDYLAKAARLLDKVVESNESPTTGTSLRNEHRERIARQYALLGAIQRGVLPQEMAQQMYDSVATKDR